MRTTATKYRLLALATALAVVACCPAFAEDDDDADTPNPGALVEMGQNWGERKDAKQNDKAAQKAGYKDYADFEKKVESLEKDLGIAQADYMRSQNQYTTSVNKEIKAYDNLRDSKQTLSDINRKATQAQNGVTTHTQQAQTSMTKATECREQSQKLTDQANSIRKSDPNKAKQLDAEATQLSNAAKKHDADVDFHQGEAKKFKQQYDDLSIQSQKQQKVVADNDAIAKKATQTRTTRQEELFEKGNTLDSKQKKLGEVKESPLGKKFKSRLTATFEVAGKYLTFVGTASDLEAIQSGLRNGDVDKVMESSASMLVNQLDKTGIISTYQGLGDAAQASMDTSFTKQALENTTMKDGQYAAIVQYLHMPTERPNDNLRGQIWDNLGPGMGLSLEDAQKMAQAYMDGSPVAKHYLENAFKKNGKEIPQPGTTASDMGVWESGVDWVKTGVVEGAKGVWEQTVKVAKFATNALTDVGDLTGVTKIVTDPAEGMKEQWFTGVSLIENQLKSGNWSLANAKDGFMYTIEKGADIGKTIFVEPGSKMWNWLRGVYGLDDDGLERRLIETSLICQGASPEEAQAIAWKYQIEKKNNPDHMSTILSDFAQELRNRTESTSLLPLSEQQQIHLELCLERISKLEKEMAKYEGRDLTPEEQAAYDELKKQYEQELFQKAYLEDSIKDAKEEEAEEAAKKKAEEEAQKKAEEEAAKKAEEEAEKEAGVEFDENGNPIIGDADDYAPLEDPDKQDWTPFEDDEEPQEGGSPYGEGYNPFEDDGKEPEEGGEEEGEEESYEPEEETDEFEPGQEPETEDEDEPYPPEEDAEKEPYEPEEDEETEPYEPEEDEEQEPSEPEEDEQSESYEPQEDEEQEPYEPEENEEPETIEPDENEEPEPSDPEENEEPEPFEPEEEEEPEPSEPVEEEEPEPSEPEEEEEPEPSEPEEEEEPEPTEPEEEEEPEPSEPEEYEEPEPYEPEEDEELETYEPPSSLRDEPKLDPDNENYEPCEPNSAFKSWLDWNNQVSINKGNESQILNQYITQEREQESKNTIAQQNADDTRNQGGEAAQTTSSQSASEAANAQSENSWTTHLSDAIQESIEAGLTEAGGTFGRSAGEQLASNLFDKDKNKGGGGGGSGEGGGGGGGDHGDGEGGHEGGGGHGGDGGGGGGGGHGHDYGEDEGGEGGCSEGDSGDYDDGTGGDYDDGTGGDYDDGTGGGYDDHDSGGGYDDGGGYDGGGGGGGGGRITFNTPGSYTVRSRLEPVEPEPVAKEEPQEAKSSGCPGPVHHGCGGCVYEGEWDDDKGGRFWICDKCGHKDHWGPWLE